MRVVLLLAIGVVLSAPALATAQSLNGVTLGDTVEVARAAWPAAKLGPPNGKGLSLLLQDGALATVCADRVVSVQRRIGRRFHDYAATSQLEAARSGSPRIVVRNYRLDQGEVSILDSTWPRKGFTYEISFLVAPGQPDAASETYILDQHACK
jgi:hypothetical protein